jgi:hypothetical protein
MHGELFATVPKLPPTNISVGTCNYRYLPVLISPSLFSILRCMFLSLYVPIRSMEKYSYTEKVEFKNTRLHFSCRILNVKYIKIKYKKTSLRQIISLCLS